MVLNEERDTFTVWVTYFGKYIISKKKMKALFSFACLLRQLGCVDR